MALKASWWRWTQNPRLLFLLSGLKSRSTFISNFSLRMRLHKSNEGIANFWILLKTNWEIQYSKGLYGRQMRAAKKEFVILHPQAWKVTLEQRDSWVSRTVGTCLGRTALAGSVDSLAHLHCSTGECNITSDWNHIKLWLKVVLGNPLVLALARTWVEEFVQRLVCCFMP